MGGNHFFAAVMGFNHDFCFISNLGWGSLAEPDTFCHPWLHLHGLQPDCHDHISHHHERIAG